MRRRSWYLVGGAAVLLVALSPPVEEAVLDGFTAHMVQHLLITMVACPLFVMGAPIATLLRSLDAGPRRKVAAIVSSRGVRFVTSPAFSWTFFAVVMWATHFSPLYEAALTSTPIHLLEHSLYITAGLLFWEPVIARDPRPGRMRHPLRVGYLLAAVPVQSFLGLAIYSSNSVLYDHYAEVKGVEAALDDQRSAGLVMWLGGDALMLICVVMAIVAWMRAERGAELEGLGSA